MSAWTLYRTLVFGLLCALCGCQGIALRDIRAEKPVFATSSHNDAGSMLVCLTNTDLFGRLDTNVRVLSLPDHRQEEISIGALQMAKFKVYYLVTLTNADHGSTAEIRYSGGYFFPLSEERLEALVSDCAART
jgi:hypothetical protein